MSEQQSFLEKPRTHDDIKLGEQLRDLEKPPECPENLNQFVHDSNEYPSVDLKFRAQTILEAISKYAHVKQLDNLEGADKGESNLWNRQARVGHKKQADNLIRKATGTSELVEKGLISKEEAEEFNKNAIKQIEIIARNPSTRKNIRRKLSKYTSR